ncbi:hypothetical protein [Agromyces ramosus]|uniref:Uncharacterized protein n=1 Tax=Agromyces ramosus TaxID=33879 RepID=A0ABU0R4S4_9MICO|nr:hypothetical protein [Agromyces ramosus]MDQ0893083.1 hypothetical protein [Agromyces ramosus]
MNGETMQQESTAGGGWPGIALVWAIALVGVIVVVARAYSGANVWFGDSGALAAYGALGVVLAASVLGSLIVQLASRRPAGFVSRTSASVGGAVVIVATAALAIAPSVLG